MRTIVSGAVLRQYLELRLASRSMASEDGFWVDGWHPWEMKTSSKLGHDSQKVLIYQHQWI